MRYQIPTRQGKLLEAIKTANEATGTGPLKLAFYPATCGPEAGERPCGGYLWVVDFTGAGFECGWLSGHLGFSDAILLLDDDRIPAELRRSLMEALR